jgi:hypothetical protein
VHFVFGDLRYCVDGKKEVPVPDAEETARADFEHPDFAFIFVNKEVTYVTDLFAILIDDFATPNVLVSIFKSEACVPQLYEWSIACVLLFHLLNVIPIRKGAIA